MPILLTTSLFGLEIVLVQAPSVIKLVSQTGNPTLLCDTVSRGTHLLKFALPQGPADVALIYQQLQHNHNTRASTQFLPGQPGNYV